MHLANILRADKSKHWTRKNFINLFRYQNWLLFVILAQFLIILPENWVNRKHFIALESMKHGWNGASISFHWHVFYRSVVDGNHIPMFRAPNCGFYSVYSSIGNCILDFGRLLQRCGLFLITCVKMLSMRIVVCQIQCRIEFNAACAAKRTKTNKRVQATFATTA